MDAKQEQPSITELYLLAGQLERDHDASLHTLRQRDHAIGERCEIEDDVQRLRFWLRDTSAAEAVVPGGEGAALLLRLLALALGFTTMAGFLLASGRGLVNVFLFLGLFVLLQLLFTLAGALALLRASRGTAPAVSSLNPGRLLLGRRFLQLDLLRPCGAVLRLFALRVSQESGMLFTLGAVAAYLLLLAFSDFTFVWGSTFGISDAAVDALSQVVAAPWATWLPAAVPSTQLIADSRFHPAISNLAMADLVALRAWWPFLLMSLLTWALLPRLLLWWLVRRSLDREVGRAFVAYPGAAAVLSRMRAPLVRTQAQEPEESDAIGDIDIAPHALLLDWAGALAAADPTSADQLAAVQQDQRLAAGSGSPRDDEEVLGEINRQQPRQLLVAVRSWEPPMADLRDLLRSIEGAKSFMFCLVPLPGRAVTDANLSEWAGFAGGLALPAVTVRPLRGA